MTKVAVFGSLNHDITVTVPHMPASDETLIALGLTEFCGGKGFNQAVAAARLGASTVAMIGAVGRDAAGDLVRSALDATGVDHSHVSDVSGPTGTALITTDGHDVTIVIVAGANAELDAAAADHAADLLASCDVLILQGEVSSVASAHAARLARAGGAFVVFSPAPVRNDALVVLEHATHIVANRGEATELGLSPSETVVVTLGSDGARVGAVTVPPFPADAVDPTGAGDAFTAAFAVALGEGCDVYEAALRGNAAGSWAVRVAGAEPSMPTRAQLEHVLRSGSPYAGGR